MHYKYDAIITFTQVRVIDIISFRGHSHIAEPYKILMCSLNVKGHPIYTEQACMGLY